MNIFLDDNGCRANLLPFTLTRHTADIRLGINTLREKWTALSGTQIITEKSEVNTQTVIIPANILPTMTTWQMILNFYGAHKISDKIPDTKYLDHPWQIFQYNAEAIVEDFEVITPGRISEPVAATNITIGSGKIFIDKGAMVNFAMLNTTEGPIYIGKNVTVMEGAMIRGPFAANENSVIKMGAKIYGGTTLGPSCVAGGEIKNTVFFGYSNKAHDGYIGDSVIGEWCNFGAGSSNSNVKNTGGMVRYKLSAGASLIEVGNKAGLLMGDYSRCAINTSFNTGSVVGVCCNIFGEMPQKYTNHFSWGKERYKIDKALQDIENWKQMKGEHLTEKEKEMLKTLYSITNT